MDNQNNPFETHRVFKWSDHGLIEQVRPIVREVPLTIYLNDHEIVTLLCLGDYLKTLAIGFLKSEGLINRLPDLKSVFVDEAERLVRVEVEEDTLLVEKLFMRRTLTSGCGKGTTFYNALDELIMDKIDSSLKISSPQVFHLMQRLAEASDLYKMTGGVHNSALATVEDLVLFRSDIGRHNAVDKIYGQCFLENLFLGDKALVTTGRMTSEILIKTSRMGIPVLISRSAATSLAISLAQQVGVTLIGYVRGKNLIVYTGRERVLD
jgi:FdhD protein